LFYIETKPPLTLCDSVPAMLRRSFQKRQAESLAKIIDADKSSQEKVTQLLPSFDTRIRYPVLTVF
jgi:hypothetical protein